MPASVKSKFSATFLVIIGLKVLLSPIFIIAMEVWAVKNQTHLGWIIVLAIIVYVLLISAVAIELKIITATPQGLIYQILLNRKTIIDYITIVHVHSSQAAKMRNSTYPADFVAVTLDIELNTGETVFIYKNTISNYDELTDAIRRFRFGLQ